MTRPRLTGRQASAARPLVPADDCEIQRDFGKVIGAAQARSIGRGLLLVLSGPSGVGKTTLARRLACPVPGSRASVVRSVSVTTRPPRPQEANGADYHFISEPRFAGLLARGELLEQTEAFGHRYGTPRVFVETHLAAGTDVLLVLDGHGRRQIAACCPAALVSVFLMPPSLDELERRLRGRAADREDIIEARLAVARAEIAHAAEYDHVLVNRVPEVTMASLNVIRQSGRRRP